MWIQRDISSIIEDNRDLIQVLRGPRQAGKSSLILHLDPDFRELSLDDPALRELAQRDPELFLKQFSDDKLFIDEAQYAPNLFPSLKRRVDLLKRQQKSVRNTLVRLTGSNQILMDKQVKESLVGRASFFDLNTLSVAEILKSRDISIQNILYNGGWPEFYSEQGMNIKKYLDDYINTYIEKDVVLSAGIQKSREFLKFTRLLAGRVGELLDFSSLGNDVGVDSKTIKGWISVLEKMHIVSFIPPFMSNRSQRLIKSPKVFFIDTGLACRLQGWTSAEPILTSPQQGHLFENLVYSEIYKTNINFQKGWNIYHWRSKEKHEVDFLLELSPREYLFIEAKVSSQNSVSLKNSPEIKKIFGSKTPPIILCHQEGERVLENKVPISLLRDFLLKF